MQSWTQAGLSGDRTQDLNKTQDYKKTFIIQIDLTFVDGTSSGCAGTYSGCQIHDYFILIILSSVLIHYFDK